MLLQRPFLHCKSAEICKLTENDIANLKLERGVYFQPLT